MEALSRIWQRAQAGDRAGARRELADILRTNADNPQAWLLMATLLENSAQQADCYRKVLALDPQNQRAATMLQKLQPPLSTEVAPPPTTVAVPVAKTASPTPTAASSVAAPALSSRPMAVSVACPHCAATLPLSITTGQREWRTVCGYCAAEIVYTLRGGQLVPMTAPTGPLPEPFERSSAEDAAEAPTDSRRDELVRYIVRELASEADRNELIRHVCETYDMSWRQAEMVVARVALEHAGEITKRRSPFMVALSLATIVGGVVMTLLGGYSIFALFSLRQQPLLRPDYAGGALLSGLGMIAGGLIGLVRIIKSLRDVAE